MPFPDNRYSFIRAKLTGLFSFLFCSGSQKIGADHWKGRSECGTGRTKKPKKTTVLPKLQCLRGTHEKASQKVQKWNPPPFPEEKKERKKKKEKEMQSKTCFFGGGGWRGKPKSEQTLMVPVTLYSPQNVSHASNQSLNSSSSSSVTAPPTDRVIYHDRIILRGSFFSFFHLSEAGNSYVKHWPRRTRGRTP